MTPSNPSNDKPFIYRILDALGVEHQVVPVNHTHSNLVGQTVSIVINGTEIEITSEDVPNLLRALADPDAIPIADSNNLVTSGGVYSELADKANKVHDHKRIIFTSGNKSAVVQVSKDSSNKVQIELVIQDTSEVEFERKAVLNWANMANAQRAFTNPDSTPTTSSNNLVTSGGVKAALDEKQNTLTFDTTPTQNSTKPVTSGGIYTALGGKVNNTDVMPSFYSYDGQNQIDLDGFIGDSQGICRICLQNESGAAVQFGNIFFSSDGYPIHQNVNGTASIANSYYVIATIYKVDTSDHEHDICYFVELNGIFDSGN